MHWPRHWPVLTTPGADIKGKHGIVGSTARHIATSTHYKQQIQLLEENIAKLQEVVVKTKEGKSTIFAIFGKDDLAKARKELASKDKDSHKAALVCKTSHLLLLN